MSTNDKPEPPQSRDIIWTERAQEDLIEIGEYIAQDKPIAAARWVDTLIAAVDDAALFPHSGRIVPEFNRSDIREVIRRSYRVVYLVRDDSVMVLTIFEGHRRIPIKELPSMDSD